MDIFNEKHLLILCSENYDIYQSDILLFGKNKNEIAYLIKVSF